jgi:hypothetical protein
MTPWLPIAIVGIALHEHHVHVRAFQAQLFGQDATVDFRHHHVGQQEVDGIWGVAADLQRLARAAGSQNPVSASNYDGSARWRAVGPRPRPAK